MAAHVNKEQCTGCGVCIETCPADAISMDSGTAVVDETKCTDCGACVDACPIEAITIS